MADQTTREQVAIAAENLFAAYRQKYLTPSTRRIRENAPLRNEMGILKMAVDAMMKDQPHD